MELKAVTGIRSALINGNDALFLTEEGSVKQMSIVNTVYNRIRLESDPVSVATIASSSITGMAASQGELFLLRSDGQVLRWNRGLKAPSAVAGLNNVYKLDTGFYRLFALKRNGTLWQWNYNSGVLAKPYQIKRKSNQQYLGKQWNLWFLLSTRMGRFWAGATASTRDLRPGGGQ
ncbi:hypothetical protein ACFTAO_19430 [Paenibacillus rhizoplanae]